MILQAMILSGSARATASILPVLRTCGLSLACQADTAANGRKLAASKPLDIVILNTPLVDDFGSQLAIELAKRNLAVLILVKNDLKEQVAYQLEPYGILTLGRPTSGSDLLQALRLLRPLRLKMLDLEKQRTGLETKVRDLRLLSRAKLLLISHQGFSEEDANRYIEKTAMDRCVKKRTIAQEIIRLYDSKSDKKE